MTKRERVMTALRGGEVDRVGPDCSINPDTPEALLHAVGAAVRNPRAKF